MADMTESGLGGGGLEGREIMRDPTGVLIGWSRRSWGYAGHTQEWRGSFEEGRQAMALEVETLVRLLEGVVGNSLLSLEKEEICSVLRTFLREQGLEDWVGENYDRLLEYRRTKFVAVSGDDASTASEPAGEPSQPRYSPGSPAPQRSSRPSDAPGG